jgi:hypothetical protein
MQDHFPKQLKPTKTVTISETRGNPLWWKNQQGMMTEAKLIKGGHIRTHKKKSLKGRTYGFYEESS